MAGEEAAKAKPAAAPKAAADPAPSSAGRLPLAIALAVVVALGVAYYIYARDQRAYFSSRNLRLLATIVSQVEEALRSNDNFVRNYGASDTTAPAFLRGGGTPLPQGQEDPAAFLPDFVSASRDCTAVSKDVHETPPSFTRTLQTRGGEPMLQIEYGEAAAATPVPGARADEQPCRTSEMVRRHAIATIPLRSILQPIFDQSLLSAFDEVMLARGDGSVIFIDHEHARSALAPHGEEEATPEVLVTSLADLAEVTGFRDTKKLDIRALRTGTRVSEIATSAGTYYLFTQPASAEMVATDADNLKQPEARRWIVGGMVSKRRFMYEVLAVSASGVLLVSALLLTMICAWPYLRIALIGPYQRLTVADVLLLGFAALIHGAILTLTVLDLLAYRSLREISDLQLNQIAARIESDLRNDLGRAVASLATIDSRRRDPIVKLADAASTPAVAELSLPNRYLTTVAWIDADGRQQRKWTMRKTTPLVNVAHRSYFENALKQRNLVTIGGGKAVAIESIRSATTGQTETVVAAPSDAVKGLPVIAVAFDPVHINHPILPPGFGFAIVDRSGKVVFHSEASRNNQENFFAETDANRRVRSAVFARQDLPTSVRYWGADHRVHVRPLRDLPWTLIVFRNKSLLRTVNTETVAMTLAMLLGNASIYLLAIILLLLWRPGYRAPQAWPVDTNAPLYGRLIVLYAITIITAGVSIYAFDPRSVLQLTMLVPPQAFAGTVLVLQRSHKARRWWGAMTVWSVVTLLWLVVLFHSRTMRGTTVAPIPGAMRLIVVLLLAATAWATFRGRPCEPRTRRWYSGWYIAAGVLLLIVATVVPTIGFFKVASRLEIEGFVKYLQLVLAERAEESIVATESASIAANPRETYGSVAGADPLATHWELVRDGSTARGEPDGEWLPEVYRNVLPAYSEESVSLRQLHDASKGAAPWSWTWSGDEITMEKRISLPNGDVKVADHVYDGHPPREQKIRVTSRVPLSFSAALHHDRFTSVFALSTLVLLLGLVAVVAVLYLIVRFIARKLFLIDVHEPLWLMPPPPLKPTLGDHIFLVYAGKLLDELTGARSERNVFLDVGFAQLQQAASPAAWEAKLLEIDRAAAGMNVRIIDFDHDLTNAALTMRMLTFLERLLSLPNRTIIMASKVSPAAFLATITNADLRRRWTTVLESFVWVTESQLEPAAPLREPRDTRDNAEWLTCETEQGAFLQGLRGELEELARHADREQLIDELLERSNAYYGGLWASCSSTEKILLNQLAREGVLNGKDRRAVRRLLARGLVRRSPNLRLFNETFRRYVVAAARRDQVPVDAQDGASAWDMIRLPLFVVLVSVMIMIFATQKDLLNMTTGLVAALTTGVPAIVRLFGLFTERRTAAAEK